MKFIALALALLTAALPASGQVEIHGSKRPKAPNNWPKFDWPKKRGILFGMYAPTPEEIALIDKAMPNEATAKPAKPRRILLFERCQYPHAAIATCSYTIRKMGEVTGAFTAVASDNPADFTPENLAQYDAVLLDNTTSYEQTLGPDGCAALQDFVKSGKGLIGIHAASDACRGWPEGAKMMNGIFHCHPWLPKGTWAFRLESPDHPLNAAFKGEGFWLSDEVYLFREGSHSRQRSRVLVSLDMSKAHNLDAPEIHQDQKKLVDKNKIYPLAWIHDYGKGRVFFSNFGHNIPTYWQPGILQHYLDGIQFALGDLAADTTPSAKLSHPASTAPAPPKPKGH